jgi:hypothetical protein
MRAKKQRELVRRITRSEKLAQRLIGSWWIEALLTTDMIRRAPPHSIIRVRVWPDQDRLVPDTSCDFGAPVRLTRLVIYARRVVLGITTSSTPTQLSTPVS